MPGLTVRTLGTSYLIEGIGPSGLDADRLRRAAVAAFGSGLGVIRGPSGPGDPGSGPIEALIVDRKAETWDRLLDRLEAWVMEQGRSRMAWTRDSSAEGWKATLEFQQ